MFAKKNKWSENASVEQIIIFLNKRLSYIIVDMLFRELRKLFVAFWIRANW